MLTSEKNLLLAVRNRLRTQLTLTDLECVVDCDEEAASVAGHKLLIVMPNGVRPGPRHETSGGVHDLIVGVSVLVIQRSAHIARDRQREVFIGNLGELSSLIDAVHAAIDFNYDLLTAANTLISTETSSTEGFFEPLRFSGLDPRPRPAMAEMFAAVPSRQQAGLMRAIHFHGARRMKTR